MKFKIVSLFSGCGGLDTGFEQTGHYNVIWANDIYLPSCQTYEANSNLTISQEEKCSPGNICCCDVEGISFSELANPGKIDVIIGGPPCQDFSIIRGGGKRKGLEVKRGRLYTHFVRAVAELQPKMLVLENVKGLLSANKGEAFATIYKDFEELNLRWNEIREDHKDKIENARNAVDYKSYKILFAESVDFSKLGVPQQRERLIMIGLRKDLLGKISLDDTKQKIVRDLLPNDNILSMFPVTPIEILSGKTLAKLDDLYKEKMLEYKEALSNISSMRRDHYQEIIWNRYKLKIWDDYLFCNRLLTHINGKLKGKALLEHSKVLKELGYNNKAVEDLDLPDKSNGPLKEKEHVKERMKMIPPGENHEFVKTTEHQVKGLMSNIYKRIHPLKPSPTVIARGGGGTWGYHYSRNRQRLNNRERARLQTFPDSFRFKGSISEVRRQIGEAVPPLASKRIAETVLAILRTVNK